MPIAVYPGLHLTGAKVKDLVTAAEPQVESQIALHDRYRTPFVLSAMDLSAEAEAFGCSVYMSDTEVPSVTGRLVTDLESAVKLAVPAPGVARTHVYLEAVNRLAKLPERPLVFGGCIGPFSLAARLVGVSEAMELTITEPELMQVLLEKSVSFLNAYIRAFKNAGANGVIMAEPAAGLLSPRGLAAFSSAPVRAIAQSIMDDGFALILHNCAAKTLHLPAILETGLKTFHFGAPMDLKTAFTKIPEDVVLCGNLDPSGVFVQMPPAQTAATTKALLEHTAGQKNFVLSSGCDIPPNAPLSNLDAFYSALPGR